MTTTERLENWKRTGIISEAQFVTLSALVSKERFSLFLELNALLYLGVLSLTGGLAWTFSAHFEKLGDVFILSVLSAMLALSFYYCLTRAPGYSNREVESPNFVLDYVLYLACLLLSVELGYIEFRFEWLKQAWDNYLLLSSLVFFAMSYRFDNRLVLSLALSSLGGWFGLKVSRLGIISSEPLRMSALVYAGVVAAVGVVMYRREIKKHFLETYLHIAANVAFIAMISGVTGDSGIAFLAILMVGSVVCVRLGIRYRKFAFVVYGVVFGYIGISTELLRALNDVVLDFAYLVLTGSAVIVLIVILARRIGREE